MPPESPEITALLKASGSGDAAALDQLTRLVYEELRRLARRYMRNERAGNTLQTTALVNEALELEIAVNAAVSKLSWGLGRLTGGSALSINLCTSRGPTARSYGWW